MQRRFLTLILFLLSAGSGSAQNGTLLCSNSFDTQQAVQCKPTLTTSNSYENYYYYNNNGTWNHDFNNTSPLKGAYTLATSMQYDTVFVQMKFYFSNTSKRSPVSGAVNCIPQYRISYETSPGRYFSVMRQCVPDEITYFTPANKAEYSFKDSILRLTYVQPTTTTLTLFQFERHTVYLFDGKQYTDPNILKKPFCDTTGNPGGCMSSIDISPMDCQLQFAYDNIEVRGKNAIVTDIQTESLSQVPARVLRTYTLLGQELDEQQPYTGFVIQYYSDGTRRKEWRGAIVP